ncbi:MAG: lysophospholipid acyltransferase family protein [Candidatus Microsaccharimonas sp.]
MEAEKYLEHVATKRQSFGAHLAATSIAGLAMLEARCDADGQENIPTDGPVIFAANHLSDADAVVLNGYLYLFHRVPTILAKDGLFKPPIVGDYMRGIHALPVARGAGAANVPILDTALRVLDRGDAVMIYPEGSSGRGEDYWPIRGKSGLGYLALNSDAPVIPIAQWGAQNILWRDETGKKRLSLWPPRKPIDISIGEPMHFSAEDFSEELSGNQRNQAVTDLVMNAITKRLATIRGEDPKGYYANPELMLAKN